MLSTYLSVLCVLLATSGVGANKWIITIFPGCATKCTGCRGGDLNAYLVNIITCGGEQSVTHCSDVTGTVKEAIIKAVEKEVPSLQWNDVFFSLAQKYGITGEKPQPDGNYIYLKKKGEFNGNESLSEMATKVLESVTYETKQALRSRPGNRIYACVAVHCNKTEYTAESLEVACISTVATMQS